jgi:hypothetical protein
VALLALVGGVISDAVERSFWMRHPLLAGLASGFIVVMLTVALINEAVERRRRERWSVLAQYVMLQLVRDARGVWTGQVREPRGWATLRSGERADLVSVRVGSGKPVRPGRSGTGGRGLDRVAGVLA